ncbi:MAG: DUF2779 domain-containing protein [Thermoanaerobaculia bacterium]
MKSSVLSKSRFLGGLQCGKRLWYEVNRREEVPPPNAAKLAIFAQGHAVGAVAQSLYPDGLEVAPDERGWQAVAAATREALSARRPLFEAGFVHGGGACRVDILVPAPDGGWDLFEVKSTASVKPEHDLDLAFQTWVVRGAGLALRDLYLVHVDSSYVLDGALDPQGLLRRERRNERVEALLPEIEPRLSELLETAALAASPEVAIGPHCSSPHDCPLIPLCWAFLPERNVTTLHGDRRRGFELLARGISRLADIPEDFRLNGKQRLQVEAARNGEAVVDACKIRDFLAALEPPLHYLDFETVNPAIPVYQGTRPFQPVPFQFSLHRQARIGGDVDAIAFLAEGHEDPRPALLARLEEALLDRGTILAYNADFERRVLRELAAAFPEEGAWIGAAESRIVDLLVPFRQFAWYHPDQDGSASMKAVLPAMTGVGYEELAIADGNQASREFLRVTFGDVPAAERARVRRDLERYCALDTLGMAHIVEELATAARHRIIVL